MDEFLTTGEFERSQKTLNRTIVDGFEGVHQRFDHVDDITRDLGERVAGLEQHHRNQKSQTRKTAGMWGAGIGSAVAAFLIALLQFFGFTIGGKH